MNSLPIQPKNFIVQKEEQLRGLVDQALRQELPYCCGLYILLRWSYCLTGQTKKTPFEYFEVEFINLANATSIVRVWQAKGNVLIADSKPNNQLFYDTVCNVYPTSWWQTLYGEGLSEKSNVSLREILSKYRNKAGREYRHMSLAGGGCRISLSQRKDLIYIEYQLKMEVIYEVGIKMLTVKAFVKCQRDNFERNENPKVWIGELLSHNKTERVRELTQDIAENMIIYARDQLIKEGKLMGSNNWCLETYTAAPIHCINDCLRASFEILFRDQNCCIMIVIILVEFDGENYSIVNIKRPILAQKKYLELRAKGNKVEHWQKMMFEKPYIANEQLRPLLECGLKVMKAGTRVSDVYKIECRIKRDSVQSDFPKFEYRILVCTAFMSIRYYQEWYIAGNMNKAEELKVLCYMKMNETDIYNIEASPVGDDIVEFRKHYDKLFAQEPVSKGFSNLIGKIVLRDLEKKRAYGEELPRKKIDRKLNDLLLRTSDLQRIPRLIKSKIRNANDLSLEIARSLKTTLDDSDQMELPKLSQSFRKHDTIT